MCGIIGILHPRQLRPAEQQLTELSPAAMEVYRGLLTLQHRGQDAAGILSYDVVSRQFHYHKAPGLVTQVFKEQTMNVLQGQMAVGHVRYATSGARDQINLQPFISAFPYGLGLAHNGNLINYYSLKEKFIAQNGQLLSGNDGELLMQLLSVELLKHKGDAHTTVTFDDLVCAGKKVFDAAEGGYSIVGLLAEIGLFGMRDIHGIRPLVLGKKEILQADGSTEYSYCMASETVTLNFLGYAYDRDVKPGEIILIDSYGQVHSAIHARPEKVKAACMFEWVYFSGAESSWRNASVYQVRHKLGVQLAKKIQPMMEQMDEPIDIVVPVPDTSRTAALALAEALKLPYREALIKNRYVQRSFILAEQKSREKAVELKLSPVPGEIEGKNILLVDDSIVRGTTSKKIVQHLRDHGAKHVSFAVSCPPLKYPCFYGIDFPTKDELLVNKMSMSEIADWMGADEVFYLDENDLVEAIGTDQLCMACVNGKYPTSIEEGDRFSKKRNEQRDQLCREF